MPNPSRRDALRLLAITAVGGAMVSRASLATAAGAEPALLLAQADVCVITPETTAGPFYFDPELERSDITDGRQGLATRVRLQVVDALCKPIEGARVDIWHCDAQGQYSGYPDQPGGVSTVGEKFLRGTQMTDAGGIATFETIYPGWYPGRTAHIHFRVFLASDEQLTGQIFFPDDASDKVYAGHAKYARSGQRDTLNSNDGIALRAGSGAFATVETLPDAYDVAMIIGVGERVPGA